MPSISSIPAAARLGIALAADVRAQVAVEEEARCAGITLDADEIPGLLPALLDRALARGADRLAAAASAAMRAREHLRSAQAATRGLPVPSAASVLPFPAEGADCDIAVGVVPREIAEAVFGKGGDARASTVLKAIKRLGLPKVKGRQGKTRAFLVSVSDAVKVLPEVSDLVRGRKPRPSEVRDKLEKVVRERRIPWRKCRD